MRDYFSSVTPAKVVALPEECTTTQEADIIYYNSLRPVRQTGGGVENAKGCSFSATIKLMDFLPSDVAPSQAERLGITTSRF